MSFPSLKIVLLLGFCLLAAGAQERLDPSCSSLTQKLAAITMLRRMGSAAVQDKKLHDLYLQEGGLLRSPAFLWAAGEASFLNSKKGPHDRVDIEGFNNLARMQPKALAKLIWMKMTEQFDLSFVGKDHKDSEQLALRINEMGTTQAAYIAHANLIEKIKSDPAAQQEFVSFLENILPTYGRAAALYEQERRSKKSWRFISALKAHFQARKIDKQFKKEYLEKNKIDMASLAQAHGLDVDQFLGGTAYRPYESMNSNLEPYRPIETDLSVERIQAALAALTDHLSNFNSRLSGMNLPMQHELNFRLGQALDPERAIPLEKALEGVRGKASLTHTELKSYLAGPLIVRIEEIERELGDLTRMREDLRKLSELAGKSYEVADSNRKTVFQTLNQLRKAGTPSLDEEWDDFSRLEKETDSMEDAHDSFLVAERSIEETRAGLDEERDALRMIQTVINSNPGGHGETLGDEVRHQFDLLAKILATRRRIESAPERMLAEGHSEPVTETSTEKPAEASPSMEKKPEAKKKMDFN